MPEFRGSFFRKLPSRYKIIKLVLCNILSGRTNSPIVAVSSQWSRVLRAEYSLITHQNNNNPSEHPSQQQQQQQQNNNPISPCSLRSNHHHCTTKSSVTIESYSVCHYSAIVWSVTRAASSQQHMFILAKL